MSDAFLILLGLNAMAAVAVALVMALRLPARRLFGARIAYGLWALVPLAALPLLLQARVVKVVVPSAAQAAPQIVAAAAEPMVNAPATLDLLPLAVGLWIAGGLASLAWLAWRQVEFMRAAK